MGSEVWPSVGQVFVPAYIVGDGDRSPWGATAPGLWVVEETWTSQRQAVKKQPHSELAIGPYSLYIKEAL